MYQDEDTNPFAEDLVEKRTFRSLDLRGQTVEDKTFQDCVFVDIKWSEAKLKDCTFEACTIQQSDLTMVKLYGTKLRGVKFEGCKLMGVEWTNASKWLDFSFVGCVMDYCSFAGLALKKVKFEDCRLVEANFAGSNLSEADLSGCDLTGAHFAQTNLTKADLATATGYAISPTSNTVRGLKISLEAAIALAKSFGMMVAGAAFEEVADRLLDRTRPRLLAQIDGLGLADEVVVLGPHVAFVAVGDAQ
ncbi:MAG TPA: pentapeptide repeat-containing protein, partial [Polyangia bacterium]